jgi:hypothetical protein
MNRSLQRRVARAERLLPQALKRRLKRREQDKQRVAYLARIHATAVAGIVLHGDPKIDEPLAPAWARTVANFEKADISLRTADMILPDLAFLCEYLRERKKPEAVGHSVADSKRNDVGNEDVDPMKPTPDSWADYVAAAEDYATASEKMYLRIIKSAGKNESERFTEIFRTAPPWLLNFTSIRIDAELLQFELPDLSTAPKMSLSDPYGWPMLPTGAMTAGDPASTKETNVSDEEVLFALELAKKPHWQWSRKERLQMLEFNERISGGDVDAALKAKLEALKRIDEFGSKSQRILEPPPYAAMFSTLWARSRLVRPSSHRPSGPRIRRGRHA